MHTLESLNAMNLGDLQRLSGQLTGTPTRSPNKVSLIRKVLAAQGEAGTTEQVPANPPTEPKDEAITAAPNAAPAPAEDNLAQRLAAVRNAATIAELDALLDAPGRRVQGAVLAEVAKQRDALNRVAGLNGSPTERDELRARLAAKVAFTRPGVGVAIRIRLGELGGEETDAGAKPLTAMTTEELHAEYTRVVGRPTGSDHRGYLIWKIREALKGRVTVGAVERVARQEGVEVKVLPLRMEAPAVEALDGAWERLGYPSRMAFLREAMSGLLAAKGEGEAAKLVGGTR